MEIKQTVTHYRISTIPMCERAGRDFVAARIRRVPDRRGERADTMHPGAQRKPRSTPRDARAIGREPERRPVLRRARSCSGARDPGRSLKWPHLFAVASLQLYSQRPARGHTHIKYQKHLYHSRSQNRPMPPPVSLPGCTRQKKALVGSFTPCSVIHPGVRRFLSALAFLV
jgi:hypothetical protein